MIFRVWLRILPSSKQKPFQCLPQPGLKAVGGPVALHDEKPIVIRASHGPKYIERLACAEALAERPGAPPRIHQGRLGAQSPLLPFSPQRQKVLVRTSRASRNVDNVRRL